MIIAAGLSPAYQQILRFDKLRLGEVNRAADAVWCCSGKVFNVGLALHHLGCRSLTIAPAGGAPFIEIEREIIELDMPCRLIWCDTPTRVCTTILDAATGTTTELVENARPMSPGELDEFRRAYLESASKAAGVVLTGSQPPGVPDTLFRDLLAETSGWAILDFRGPALRHALTRRPLFVKPNRAELAETIGRPLADDNDLLSAMRELNTAGAEWVVVTHGADPVWATHGGKVFRFMPPAVDRIVNPIGCGDCLAAGIAWGISDGLEPTAAIRRGIAAAVDNLGGLLPARLDPARILDLAEQVRMEV